MRMDLPQREVAIDISEGIALPAPTLDDHELQRARVRTFIVAVGEDRHRPRSPHMIVFVYSHRHTVSFVDSVGPPEREFVDPQVADFPLERLARNAELRRGAARAGDPSLRFRE